MSEKELTTEEWRAEKRRKKAEMALIEEHLKHCVREEQEE